MGCQLESLVKATSPALCRGRAWLRTPVAAGPPSNWGLERRGRSGCVTPEGGQRAFGRAPRSGPGQPYPRQPRTLSVPACAAEAAAARLDWEPDSDGWAEAPSPCPRGPEEGVPGSIRAGGVSAEAGVSAAISASDPAVPTSPRVLPVGVPWPQPERGSRCPGHGLRWFTAVSAHSAA